MKILLRIVLFSLTTIICNAQSTDQPIPHLEKRGNATRLMVDGKRTGDIIDRNLFSF